jgi:protein ImuB
MFGALVGDSNILRDIAADFSPRFERRGNAVVLDLAGLDRLFGHPRAMAEALRTAIAEHELRAHVAIAGTCTAAHLLAAHHARPVTVVERGGDADAVAPLPLELLQSLTSSDLLATFRRWGLRSLGDLAALPADAVSARLGSEGLRWHRLAQGHDLRPLQPEVPDERFEQAFDLEWPIEGLEPLSFVLGRLLEPLSAHLERRGRGAAVLHLRLHLVTRTVHERSLQLPAAMRDARTLRTLLLLDLESNPPPAAIDRVVVAADPTPARVLQFSLLARPLPSPEQLSTLMARLGALMGEDRCGSPVVVDSWKPGAFGMKGFNPDSNPKSQNPNPKIQIPKPKSQNPNPKSQIANPVLALRRFRVPIPARVRAHEGTPLHVVIDRRGMTGGSVQSAAGPWRTSGNWWDDGLGVGRLGVGPLGVGSCSQWDRDEWDVALGDGVAYRVFRERVTGAWFLEGTFD